MGADLLELSVIVMTLTVFITEALKRYLLRKDIPEENVKFWAPFSAIILGMLLNLGMVLLLEVTNYSEYWHNFLWQQTLREGLDIGMRAGGLYGVGKVVMNRVNKQSQPKQPLTPP